MQGRWQESPIKIIVPFVEADVMIKHMVVIRCDSDMTILKGIGLDIDNTVKYAWLTEPLGQIINPHECRKQRAQE